jgi:glycerophosphoryl diester phosphodiesterase
MPPRPPAPEILAHRGGAAHAPENTLAAFRRAVRVGVDWIEFDVQRTKDGVLVAFHDDAVDRVTNGSGHVADLTLAELQALRVGAGERVATFLEIVGFAKESRVRIFPEAKNPGRYPGIVREMIAVVRKAGYVNRTVIQSFDHDVLDDAMRHEPNIQVCALTGLWQFSLSSLGTTEASYVCPMAEMILLNPWIISQAHGRRLRVFAWFGAIEHPLTMRALLALGVDGLIVDDPAALARILGR